jgi:hypothetical protein
MGILQRGGNAKTAVIENRDKETLRRWKKTTVLKRKMRIFVALLQGSSHGAHFSPRFDSSSTI